MIPAIIAFALTYVLMIALPKYRCYVALVSAVITVVFGFLPIGNVFGAVDWNIILMLSGTMITVSYFIESKMPNRLADAILSVCPNIMTATVAMSLFAGLVSAFIDNVATVLMIAPVGIAVSKKLKISPVSMIIAIAVSSNLQGAATLVGDTTSIMLGGAAGMNFNDFFFMNGKPGIFWAVQLGAVATVPIIMFLFRKHREKISIKERTEVNGIMPSVFLLLTVGLLIAASFIENKPEITNGLICTVVAVCAVVRSIIKNKNISGLKNAISEFDWQTILLLASLFIVIAGVENMGVIDEISHIMVKFGGSSRFLMYTIIVFGSVLISAFIDNIPYVATMLPVVTAISASMECDPNLFYFGLLIGATLGGNITPIGASANIAGIGILKKNGYEVKNSDFFRIGVPFTAVAVLAGYAFCWFVWA